MLLLSSAPPLADAALQGYENVLKQEAATVDSKLAAERAQARAEARNVDLVRTPPPPRRRHVPLTAR